MLLQLHKKCGSRPSFSQSKHIIKKKQHNKHQKSIFYTTRTWEANYAVGILFSLLKSSPSLCILFQYSLQFPSLYASIDIFLHNINTFSRLPTSLYTPFQSSRKLYSYLRIGQLFMEGCKLLAHHGRIWYPPKLKGERKRYLKVVGVMARPSNEIGTAYSDTWFDRIAIQHLSKSVQATTGNVM